MMSTAFLSTLSLRQESEQGGVCQHISAKAQAEDQRERDIYIDRERDHDL